MINVNLALNYLLDSSTFKSALTNGDVTIRITHDNTNSTLFSADGSTVQISWDPNAAHQVYSADYKYGIQSPAEALAHEVAHALFHADEAQATAFETKVALELGDATRGNYQLVDPAKIYVENPTEHTQNGQFVQKNLDDTYTKSGTYSGTAGEKTAASLGWGTGPSGGGGGAGTYFNTQGTIDIIGSTSTPLKKDASYWKNVPYAPEDDGGGHTHQYEHKVDISLVGQPQELPPHHG